MRTCKKGKKGGAGGSFGKLPDGGGMGEERGTRSKSGSGSDARLGAL